MSSKIISAGSTFGKSRGQITHSLIHASKNRQLTLEEVKFITDYLSQVEEIAADNLVTATRIVQQQLATESSQ